ncbi:Aste57867_18370 [Aphanomyces stellatus]|uniref:Aste57867_18370 protein n=1 Tax=Aphanomyces stellatus TaxID=120398 RepID=A0A485LBM8_9STRA|nr:hypothetical protein As57867_018308 [Aphanomyces stellatus]VFT95106.1 Aste57867_18370 [Aphanomyces stellatus]
MLPHAYTVPAFSTMAPSDIAATLRSTIDETTFDLNAFEDDLADPAAEFTWASVMDRLEIINDPLERLWRVVIHLTNVINSPELRAVETAMQAEVVALQNRCMQSPAIFHAMAALRASDEAVTYTVEQTRILHRAIHHAIITGVALVENERDRFNARSLRLTQLSMAFSNNVLDALNEFALVVHDKAELDGVPEEALALYAQNAVAAGFEDASFETGPWKVTLDRPCYLPIVKYCAYRPLREAIFRAYIAIASVPPHDNKAVVQEILQLRHAQARELGFDSYAELSLATKMAPSVSAVDEMVESLRSRCFDVSKAEIESLQAYASAHGQSDLLQPWDIAFWFGQLLLPSERLRKDAFDIDEEAMKAYFPLDRVLDGLFDLVSQLFGVRIVATQGIVDTWHRDVTFYEMRTVDEPGEPVIAGFYLDLFLRPGQKQNGSWIEVLSSRTSVLGTEKTPVRVPVYCLMLNLPTAMDKGPTLLSFSDVKALFNVFGYGLRMSLTQANYTASSRPSGVEWDCADMPGAFMSKFWGERGWWKMNCISV